jgi:hypothetical protein
MLDKIKDLIAKLYWKYAHEYDKGHNDFWASVLMCCVPPEMDEWTGRIIVAEMAEKLEFRGEGIWGGFPSPNIYTDKMDADEYEKYVREMREKGIFVD